MCIRDSLNQQRRMAPGMRLMLDNSDLRAIPRNLRHLGGQAGYEAEQVQWYLLGDAAALRDLRNPVRQLISGIGRAARRAVTGRRAQSVVPEQVIPMRMRRKPCHHGLTQLGQVVREAGHFAAVHPGVDEQHTSPALYDNRVALHELALVDQHTLRDLPQHGAPSARGLQPLFENVVPRVAPIAVSWHRRTLAIGRGSRPAAAAPAWWSLRMARVVYVICSTKRTSPERL